MRIAAPGDPLLELRRFSVAFADIPVVRGIDLTLRRGDALGLVGESGSGKSVTWLGMLGLLPPTATLSGAALLAGTDLLKARPDALARVRGGRIGLISQDPSSALNPVHRVGSQVIEALRLHRGLRGAAARQQAKHLFEQVGIPDAANRMDLYPHEMSGGQNQRVMIAMALAGQPDLLIADEPTTALDTTIQAQILDLLDRLRRENGMALVLISHDLHVVAEVCARIAVMYAGRIVELAATDAIFDAPAHPYTRGLLASIPDESGRRERLAAIPGAVPEAGAFPPGCAFAPRCPIAVAQCHMVDPEPSVLGNDHSVRCLRVRETIPA